jgi:hypothetical protein
MLHKALSTCNSSNIQYCNRCYRHLFRKKSNLLSFEQLLTVCTILILVSAYQKLALYESVYGFTLTRVLIQLFMILYISVTHRRCCKNLEYQFLALLTISYFDIGMVCNYKLYQHRKYYR